MSTEPEEPAGAEGLDENAAKLLGIVNLFAQMAMQMLRQGETEAARGFVDSLEVLQVKTKGNVGAVEEQVFESVITQLHLAVVKGPPPREEKPEDGADQGDDGEHEPDDAPSGSDG